MPSTKGVEQRERIPPPPPATPWPGALEPAFRALPTVALSGSLPHRQVTEDLQFEIAGITRSYNWLFPVAVVADWTAKRLPGRFAMVSDDDDDDSKKGGSGSGGAPIDSSGFSFPRPSDFNL